MPTVQDQKDTVGEGRSEGLVFFLVRPDGFETFLRYHGVVENHNATVRKRIDIGYEPADANWTLLYPEDS